MKPMPPTTWIPMLGVKFPTDNKHSAPSSLKQSEWAPALVALAFPQPQTKAALSPERQAAADSVRNYRAKNQSLVNEKLIAYQQQARKIAWLAARYYGVDPEDVAQTVALNLLSYGGLYDGQKPFLAWLNTITYRAAYEEARKRMWQPSTAPAEALENALDKAPGPMHFIDMRDLLNHVIAWAAAALDVKHLSSWRLSIAGVSEANAVAMLNISRSAHNIRVLRSREKVVKKFGHLADFGAKKYRGSPPSAA